MPVCIITTHHSGWKFEQLKNDTTWIRYSTDINRISHHWWDLGVIDSVCETVYDTLFPLFKRNPQHLRVRRKYVLFGRIVRFSYIPPLKKGGGNCFIHEEEMKDYINVKFPNRVKWRVF